MANTVLLAAAIGISIFALAACQTDSRVDDLDQRVSALERRLTNIETAMTDGPTIMDVTVGPSLLDCVGLRPMKCLEVDGELFYQDIQGFEHEEGYAYRLKIERYDAFPGQQEPPQDASRWGYRLIEIVSKSAR